MAFQKLSQRVIQRSAVLLHVLRPHAALLVETKERKEKACALTKSVIDPSTKNAHSCASASELK